MKKITITTNQILFTATLIVATIILGAYIHIETRVASPGAAAPCNYPGEAHPLSWLKPCF